MHIAFWPTKLLSILPQSMLNCVLLCNAYIDTATEMNMMMMMMMTIIMMSGCTLQLILHSMS